MSRRDFPNRSGIGCWSRHCSVYQSAASAYYCTWFMVQMGGSDQYCNATRLRSIYYIT